MMAHDKTLQDTSLGSSEINETGGDSSSSRSPECDIGKTGKPVPTIKLQRKCASRWTCSPASKLRRGRIKLKLNPTLSTTDEPFVKEEDASLRIATDLPRFNWLEMKLSQQCPSDSDHPAIRCASLKATAAGVTESVLTPPVKTRRLDFAQNSSRETKSALTDKPGLAQDPFGECRLPLKKRPDASFSASSRDCSLGSAQNQIEGDLVLETSVSGSTSASKWPLKKRIIRPTNTIESETPSPIRSSEEICSSGTRGPIICKNLVLPPTPPSSSAPTEGSTEGSTESSDEIQEEPLDLSKPLIGPLQPPKLTFVKRAEETANDVEIISVMKRTHESLPVPPVIREIPRRPVLKPARLPNSQQLHQIYPINRIQPHGMFSPSGQGAFKAVQKSSTAAAHNQHVIINTGRERPILPKVNSHLPTIRSAQSSVSHAAHSELRAAQFNSFHHKTLPHSHQLNRPISDSGSSIVRPLIAPVTKVESRLLSMNRNQWSSTGGCSNVRPDVEVLHSADSLNLAHFLRTKDGMSSRKSVSSSLPHSLAVTNDHTTSHWPSTFRCNVCNESAGFRCAGCHLYAYCSTECQAKDWPSHSRTCRVSS